jgi:WW domain
VEPQATPKPQALPPPPQQHHRGSMSVATGAPPPPPAAEAPQSPDQKPLVDLPLGWMCVWSKSQKRWYFFDTKTNKSVWKWPPGS